MKKLLTIATSAAIIAMAGTAMADDTGTLTVSANVAATCQVSDGTLNFGELTPLTAPLVEKTTNDVKVACTNGTAYTLTTNKGTATNPGTLTSGTSTINYTLDFTSTGTGTGLDVIVPIKGTIAAGTYKTAAAGTYTDTITLTVTP